MEIHINYVVSEEAQGHGSIAFRLIEPTKRAKKMCPKTGATVWVLEEEEQEEEQGNGVKGKAI